jgi:NAD(P)-dependent dehydrogenase (short-subunit alcohol dehydrogenase family)
VSANVDVESLLSEAPRRYPELGGKVALVTGGNRNIGLGIAARLAAEGMRLVISGQESDEVERVCRAFVGLGCQSVGVPGNLADSAHIDALFERAHSAYGGVDVLVNNAADLTRLDPLEVDQTLLDSQLAVNIRAPFLCAQHAARSMRTAGGGCIINISSVGGLRAHQVGSPYDATKGAIDAMTRSLAVDLAPHHIRVNAVAPGSTYTTRTLIYADPDPAMYQAVLKRIPLGRSASVLEIAAAVAFLARPTPPILRDRSSMSMAASPPSSVHRGSCSDFGPLDA